MLVATVVHPEYLPDHAVDKAETLLLKGGAAVLGRDWLEPGQAVDLLFGGMGVADARARLAPIQGAADLFVQPVAEREKRLIIADMDSTMITIECIDELADFAGIKDEVAGITEAAMRGELDFVAALDARVALLRGLPAAVLDRCYEERVRLTRGARTLVRTMAARGAPGVLVSGGFTAIAERVARAIGFSVVVANELVVRDGQLAGTVARPVVTGEAKLATLEREAAERGLTLDQCLAVGDGANDIPMIAAAGLGIAYRAKPKARAAAAATIDHGDLTALLYAQGYRREIWADAGD